MGTYHELWQIISSSFAIRHAGHLDGAVYSKNDRVALHYYPIQQMLALSYAIGSDSFPFRT